MGSVGRPAIMSLLLLLLPVALAGLPPHHQQLRDLEQKTSTLTRMCELPSVTLAWKSLLRAMEELRASTKQAWSFHKGRLPVGEHGSILDRRQRSAHHPRPDVQPGDLLPQVGCLRDCRRLQCWSDERRLH